jgi:hypothetical protein
MHTLVVKVCNKYSQYAMVLQRRQELQSDIDVVELKEKRLIKQLTRKWSKDCGPLCALHLEVRKATQAIPQTFNKTLRAFPSDLSKEVVLHKVLFNPIVTNVIPNLCIVVKETFVKKDLLYGVMQSLSKVKRPSTSTKLVMKHAILIALISGSSIFSV